jgi:hypothetical protein
MKNTKYIFYAVIIFVLYLIYAPMAALVLMGIVVYLLFKKYRPIK